MDHIMGTITTHAAAIARTFGKDSAAVAARVTALYAAHSDGLTGGKSLAELAQAATDARIAAAMPNLSRGDYPDYRTDDRYRVGKSTLGTYSLAASLIRDMGLAPSDLDHASIHAVYRTTANRAGITDLRQEAAAAVVALPATERAGAVFGLFDAAYTLYREAAKKPEATVKKTEDRTPVADSAEVEARPGAATAAAAVAMSAEQAVETVKRLAQSVLTLTDDDAVAVFDAVDALSDLLRERPAVGRHVAALALAEEGALV